MSIRSTPLAIHPRLRSRRRRVDTQLIPEATFVVASSLEVGQEVEDVEWTVSWVAACGAARDCYPRAFRVTLYVSGDKGDGAGLGVSE